MLCVGSPLTAWLTSRIERRTLLTATLLVLALTNAASAFAPDYATLLMIRLVMLAVGALYTPQAAGTAALIVGPARRGSTIAYIFLGWSLAAALGLPLITFIASRYGWRAVYGGIGLIGVLSFLLLAWRLPRGLIGAPVDLKTWADLGRNRMIILLLAITTLQMSGQFVVFTFMGPLLAKLTNAGPDAVGLVFAHLRYLRFRRHCHRHPHRRFLGRLQDLGAVYGPAADRRRRMGAQCRHLSADGGLGRDLGLGFASTNSMQQVRLIAAAPALAPASVALNTSVLYVGQAIGSGIGGVLYARDLLHGAGYVALGFVALALITVIATRPRRVPAPAGQGSTLLMRAS